MINLLNYLKLCTSLIERSVQYIIKVFPICITCARIHDVTWVQLPVHLVQNYCYKFKCTDLFTIFLPMIEKVLIGIDKVKPLFCVKFNQWQWSYTLSPPNKFEVLCNPCYVLKFENCSVFLKMRTVCSIRIIEWIAAILLYFAKQFHSHSEIVYNTGTIYVLTSWALFCMVQARESVRARSQVEEEIARKKKEQKEEHLRQLAQLAREERGGIKTVPMSGTQ